MSPELTILTFLPAAGALVLALIRPGTAKNSRALGLLFALLPLAFTLYLCARFDPGKSELQFWQRYDWIHSLGVQYFVGLDGLGLIAILLTGIVMGVAVVASNAIKEDAYLYFALLLLLQSCMYGAFTALNFVHWFIFWELSLIPAYFLIRLWGGANASRAAGQFFIYTFVGSVTMLLSFMAIYVASGTFDFIELAGKARTGELTSLFSVKLGWYDLSTRSLALIIFFCVFLGFAVKTPLMPFHTWLPEAYSEAPTGTTIALTGAMSKMGVYGFLRILLPLFPEQVRQMTTPLLWLVIATIVLSALAALAQRDLKRMLEYSSINHLGYCLLGAFAAAQIGTADAPGLLNEKAAAANGVLLQMFNHAITASALFFFVGLIEQRSGGDLGVDQFGGLRRRAPVLAGLMGIALFASLGLPGLNGFVGEFLIFKGSFSLVQWAAVASVAGLLITAIFLLTLIQRVFSGPLGSRWTHFPDLTRRELLAAVPIIGLMFVVGIYPQLLLRLLNHTAVEWVSQLVY